MFILRYQIFIIQTPGNTSTISICPEGYYLSLELGHLNWARQSRGRPNIVLINHPKENLRFLEESG